jgi:hypothetical protein
MGEKWNGRARDLDRVVFNKQRLSREEKNA